jgi:SNF2 family DNA or RNA helicase
MKYTFKITPYQHQLIEFRHHLKHPSSATFSETGAGKTLPILASSEARISWGIARKALYVCPAYLMSKIKQQVDMCTNMSATILHDKSRQKRIDLIGSDDPFHIINIEAVILYEEYLRESSRRGRYDIVIMDEAHQIKGHNSERSKAMQRLGNLAKFRIAATGTPFTRSPEDMYGIMKFIDPSIFDIPLYKFHERYCKREMVNIGWDGSKEKNVLMTTGFKDNIEDEFRNKYSEIVVIHKKSECLDLPPKFIEVRRVNLSSALQKPYKKIVDDHIIFMPDGSRVEMPNKGVQSMRLSQLCSGFLQYGPVDNKQVHHFGRSGKIDALRDILEGRRDKKTAVWCMYRESIGMLEKEFGSWNPVIQMGQRDNTGARNRFQQDNDCKLIISQMQINAGYELTASDCCVYFEIPQSYADWKQSQDRFHRPGAEIHKQILYYLLITSGTVEASARVGLKRKEDLSDLVLSIDPKKVFLGELEDNNDDMS